MSLYNVRLLEGCMVDGPQRVDTIPSDTLLLEGWEILEEVFSLIKGLS